MELTIQLPPVNPVLHAHNTGHWAKKKNAIKALRELAYVETLSQMQKVGLSKPPLGEPLFVAALLHYRFCFPDRRARDRANAIQSMKAAIDGITDTGILPDDNWRHVNIGSVGVEVDPNNPRTEIRFEFQDQEFAE